MATRSIPQKRGGSGALRTFAAVTLAIIIGSVLGVALCFGAEIYGAFG